VQTITVGSWKECEEQVRALIDKYGSMQVGNDRIDVDVIFRGQANSDWPLNTTLERRALIRDQRFLDYVALALSCAPRVEGFLGKSFKLPTLAEIEEQSKAADAFSLIPKVPCFDYLVYLRHHGFPSPLLDWTKSFEIAAFFAFEPENDAKQASVFAYIEMPHHTKAITEDFPNIWAYDLVPGKLHERHSLQQSVYTMCTERIGADRRFTSHESVFEYGDDEQDMLIKIDVLRKERPDVLDTLHNRGINAHSLFHSSDSLMKTLVFERQDVFLQR
jgi:hypothetical protein